MAATEWDEPTFEAQRPRLFSIAYRMLGRVSKAEDILQDAWVRARQAEDADVRSPRAYLPTIVTRLCIDHLRSAERTRMEYPRAPDICFGRDEAGERSNGRQAGRGCRIRSSRALWSSTCAP